MNLRKLMTLFLVGSVLVVSAVNAKGPSNGMDISKARLSEDNSTFNISAPDNANFIEMSLQIKTEAGDVIFEKNSQGDDLFFMVDASVPDGEYWYTIKTTIMLSEEQQATTPANPDHIVATQQSRFYVLGGYRVSEDQYIDYLVNNPQAKNENVSSSYLLSLAGTVVDFLIGSAHADITVTDGSNGAPQLFFNDDNGVDDTGIDADWEIFGNAGGTVGFFRLRNNLGADQSSNIFGIDGSSTSNGGMTFLIQEDGDVEFGGSRAAFTSSTTEPALVIGGLTPTFSATINLELQDDTPYLLFRDTGNGANAGLFNSGTDFILEGNSGFQDIFTFDLAAPSNSLFVDATGDVGLGTSNPNAALNVVSGNDAQIRVDNTTVSPPAGDQVMFQLQSAAVNKVRFAIGKQGALWTFDNAGTAFQINLAGTGSNEFRVEGDGDIVALKNSFAVNHFNTSSRNSKTDFAPIDEIAILEKLTELPMSTWRYKIETEDERHLGPIAEDFQQAFGFSDGNTISTVDASGVALTAIKGLNKVMQMRSAEIAELTQANSDLQKANADLISANQALDERLTRLENVLFHENEVAVR